MAHSPNPDNLDYTAPDGSYEEKVLDYLEGVQTNTQDTADGIGATSIALVSTDNSTTATLAGDAVYTGTSEDVSSYSQITVSYATDVTGATDGLEMQFSPDGTNWDRSIKITPPQVGLTANFGGVHTLAVINQYFRIVYTNGSGAQSHFRLQTIYHRNKNKNLTSRSQQVLNKMNDVELIRQVSRPEDDKNLGLVGYIEQGRKFGANPAVGNGAFEDIWYNGGSYTLLTSAETVRVKVGGNAADDSAGLGARTITIYGLDENWAEQSETITLAGASASSATTTTFIRINRAEVATVGTANAANTGNIVVEGVTSSTVLANIEAGYGRTQLSMYAVPANKTLYITAFKISVGAADSADVRLWHTQDGSLALPFKHYEFTLEDFSGYNYVKLETYLKYTEKETVGFDAKRITGSGSARVSCDFDYILVDND
jgi:hypothetical protein